MSIDEHSETSEVFLLDEYRPHCHGKITCSFCGYVWVGVWPVDTQMLECKNCGGLKLIADYKGEGE